MSVSRTCHTCGYSRTYASAAQADNYFTRHSCTKHHRRAAAAHQRQQIADGAVRRDCQHHAHPHAHGTRVAYVKDRCRCRPCMDANTAANRRAKREQTFGRWQPYIDAEPVRAHLADLVEHGLGLNRIAELAGTSRSHLNGILGTSTQPPARRLRPDTAARILAIPADAGSVADGVAIDATGTHRRLQALMAIGWTMPQLTAQLNRGYALAALGPRTLARTLHSSSVRASTARAVADLYERLWDQQPPTATIAERAAAAKARARAQHNGWPPPLGWDDIDTDPEPDPTTPSAMNDDDIDEIAVERGVAGDGIRLEHLTPAEQAEVVRRLTERGKSIRDIAAQLATTTRTVSRKRLASTAA